MTTIVGHTTRANGTILTATIYNADHQVHITNASALNVGKLELSDLADYYTSIEVDALIASLTREALTADRTYYVRSDGDDLHDGLADTAGGAFATIQHAIDVILGTLDLAGFDVTIQVRDGTFARAVMTTPQVGDGSITLQGNSANPENVILTATSIGQLAGIVDVENSATLFVKDLTITSVVSGSGLFAKSKGAIFFENLNFDDCGSHHIMAQSAGYIEATGDYSIVGNADRHVWANTNSEIRIQSRTVTLTGTPAFTTAFVAADYSAIATVNGNTWTGSATGKRFSAANNGVIAALAGLTELPGDAAGTVDSGGMYPDLGEQISFKIVCGDETTNITAAANKGSMRMPFKFVLTDIRASLATAQATGVIFTVDVNEAGSSILSTKLTIDNTEKTSTTAATPRVISDTALADDAEITVDVDQIGTAGAKGLKVTLIGHRTV